MTQDIVPVPEPESSAAHQLRTIWRYRWVVAVGFVLTLLATLALGLLGSPRYTSTAEVLVQTTSTSPADTGDPSKLLSLPTEVQVAKSEKVASAVAQQTGSNASPASLVAHLRVSSPPNTAVLRFAYDAGSAAQAQRLADAFARAYLADREARTVSAVNRLTQVLTDEATALDQRRAALDADIAKATTSTSRIALSAQRSLAINEQLAVRDKLVEAHTVDTTPGDVVSNAVAPAAHSGPSTKSLAVLGVLLGLAVGLAAAWLLAGLRGPRSGPGPSDPSRGIPVLATIPAQRTRGSSPSGDLSRKPGAAKTALAARFGFGAAADRTRVLMVAAPRRPGPAAAAVVELATALAGGSRTVAVVEADLRRPVLLSLWGVDGGTRAAAGKAWPWEPVVPPGLDGVTVYPAGGVGSAVDRALDEPRAVLSAADTATFLKDLREQFSHVLVLVPPVLGSVDALELLASVDGVILATSRTEEETAVSQASGAIELAGGSVLGAVTVVARRSFSSLFR